MFKSRVSAIADSSTLVPDYLPTAGFSDRNCIVTAAIINDQTLIDGLLWNHLVNPL
jgi:hypothetical protein